MTPKLVVASGKSAGRTISVKREKLLIGRADECDVRPLSEDVSRRHCEFVVADGSFVVEDLRSRNGTFVNGARIEGRRQLVDGDIVRIGSLELKVSCGSPPGSSSRGSGSAVAAGSDDEVSHWLMADDEPAGIFDTTTSMRVADSQTVPVSADATPKNPPADAAKPSEDPSATVIRGRTPVPSAGQKKQTDNSRAAAAEALKKFFGNR